MPKFYVQSGNLQLILQAHDSRCAALWAVHRTLSQSLPFLCDEPKHYVARHEDGCLGETIHVHEQGFGRVDGDSFDTLDVLTEWNRLLVALDRLSETTGHQLTAEDQPLGPVAP
jgi:hypothetical protein